MPPNQNKPQVAVLPLPQAGDVQKYLQTAQQRQKKSKQLTLLLPPCTGTDPAGGDLKGTPSPCPISQERLWTPPPQQERLKQAALGDTQALPEVQERSWSPLEGGALSQA